MKRKSSKRWRGSVSVCVGEVCPLNSPGEGDCICRELRWMEEWMKNRSKVTEPQRQLLVSSCTHTYANSLTDHVHEPVSILSITEINCIFQQGYVISKFTFHDMLLYI